ncbi:Major Facilitator Superfamily (MFS) protein [Tubulinosema ratisbonensis]|uniref:Major Facilitator Superfamily (MFS) protein n=1 Tax=Tubulinosema ratisbonensis TaxID=291195 RepID=A0A437AMN5_9MICR|nr:Major Facilitator Superfamily (MFS) protein [Tubulinosema ratisbonensis]
MSEVEINSKQMKSEENIQTEIKDDEKLKEEEKIRNEEKLEPTDYYSVFVGALTSLLFGINLTSYATLSEIFKEGKINKAANLSFAMSERTWPISQSILNIGAIFGNIFIGFIILNDKFILILNDFFFLIGYMLLLYGNKSITVILARFIIGIGIGIVSSITPIYLSKLANKKNKGIISTCHQLFIMFGVLCGNIISYFCSTAERWKISIFIQIGIVILHFLAAFFTKKVTISESNEIVSIRTLFTDKNARRSVIIAFALHIGQQMTCINGIIFESDRILEKTGNPKAYSMVIGVAAILGVFVTMSVIDKFGRKILLLFSTTLVSLFLFLIGANLFKTMSLFGFIIAFSVGMGPIPWFITNEIFKSNYVGTINMVSIPTNWFTSYLITQTIELMLKKFGDKVFWVFSGITMVLTIFILLFFRETKGKNPGFQ